MASDQLKLGLPKIYLASKSPRRKKLLELAGFGVEVISIDCEENYPAELAIDRIAEFLAELKMKAARDRYPDITPLLTADTIVSLDNQILEKPNDSSDAKRMLRSLAGRAHHVYTGVSVLTASGLSSFTSQASVFMHGISEREIEYYVDHWSPFDKAGSYGIQDWIGWVKISKIEGSYATVMGLPIDQIYHAITGQDRSA